MSRTVDLAYGSEWRGLTVGVPYDANSPDEAKRKAWVLARQNSIGSSDSAKVIGVSPYGQAWDVWWSKTNSDGGE